MKGVTKRRCLFVFLALAALPIRAHAQIIISEIMYDPPGADSGQEWVELYNSGTSSVDLTKWKIHDSASHVLNPPPKNGSEGSLVLESRAFMILASDATSFRISHPDVTTSIIDTVLNLPNAAGSLSLLDASGTVEDSLSYSSALGAAGNGDSLQRAALTTDSSLAAGPATPGDPPPAGGLVATPSPAPKAIAAPVHKTSAKISKPPVGGVVVADAETPSVSNTPSEIPSQQTAAASSAFSANYIWWVGAFALAGAAGAAIIASSRFKKREWDIVEEKGE